LPAAVGQSPPSTKQFNLRIQPDAKQTIAKDLGSATIGFNVSIVAQNPTNPLNGQFTILVSVGKNPNQSIPNGWSYGEPSQKTFYIKPGDPPVRITAVITLTTRPPSVDSVSPRYDFHSTPQYQGSNPGDFLTAQLVKAMSQEDQQTSSADVNRALTPAAAISSFVKDNKWYLLAAAAGIFVVGVVLVRKKGGALTVSTEQPVQEVLPGRGASFPIEVRSQGGPKQAVSLTTSDVPEEWSAILPVDRIELAGNDAATIWLTLKSPASAQPGQHIQVNFVATSPDGGSAETMVEAVVVAHYGGPPGSSAPMAAAPRTRARAR